MARASANPLFDQLRFACQQLQEAQQLQGSEQRDALLRGWQTLRKSLEVLPIRQMRNTEVTPAQVGTLYALRALVGEVHYNVLPGDSRRHEPLEPHVLPGFQQLSDRVRTAIESGVLQLTEGNSLSALGEAVVFLEEVVDAIDRGAAHQGVGEQGVDHGPKT